MLTQTQIIENREKFIDLLKSINREDSDIDGLINYLDTNGFFTSPVTTQYHGSYEGGLCEHSLNVYRQLARLVKGFTSHIEEGKDGEEVVVSKYDTDTVKIIGLLHDICKTNYYEQYNKNVKNEATGKWEQVSSYKVKDAVERDLCGDLAFNSFRLISRYIPLNTEEVATIINANCGMDNGYANKDLYNILDRYPLTVLLHSADMISCYVDKL